MMSGEDINSISRRKVMKKAATAGAVSLGAMASTSSVSAKKGKDIAMLEAEGVLLTDSDMSRLSNEGVEVSQDVRTGRTLLNQLAEDGLLKNGSLGELPVFNDNANRDGNVHYLGDSDSREIAFTMSTPKGRLQVTFGQHSIPSAILTPKDGGSPIAYSTTDGVNYEQKELDITVSQDSDVSTEECSCSGCDCMSNWCVDGAWPKSKKQTCANCLDGECVFTNNCGC